MKSFKTYLIALGAIASLGTLAAGATPATPAPEPQAEPAATPSPAELIATRCLICHGNPTAGNRRLAPPFRMVKMHYDDLDEAAFVKAVSAWVKQPDKAKSRMPGAIRNFGLMPPQPHPEAEISAIATYLYRTDFPMPGRGGGGMGRGRMAGCSEPDETAARGTKAAAETPPADVPESRKDPQEKR